MKFGLSNYTPKQIIGLFIISLLLLIENIDAHILNVAIPQMANTFNTSIFTMKLSVTSYLIGLSIFIPISGWIADRFGAKYTLVVSIVLFSLMSAICGVTNSVTTLVICRLLQGLAGAFMVPVARLLLLKIFGKEQMVHAYTIMGIPVMIGPVIAPILGGYLVTFFTWRYIFWVNIPLGVFALVATIKFIDNYTEEQGKFDILSFVFLGLFLGSLCFLLDIILLPESTILFKFILLVASICFGLIYYHIESKSIYPIVRYHLFKLRTFRNCFLSTIVVRASLGGRAFILAVFFEVTFHLSAFKASFYLIWMAFGVLSSRTLVKKLIEKHGFKSTLTYSNIGSCFALFSLVFADNIGVLLYLALFLNGVFASAQFMTMNILYYAEVDEKDYGSAVSLIATWQQLGTSLGVIVAASCLSIANHVLNSQFSITSFHITFAILAVINLCSQFFINQLHSDDGNTMLKKRKKL